MSIASNMKKYMLQEKKEVRGPSGAKKTVWTDVKEIDVSIKKTSSVLNTQSVRYNESTHIGITFYRNIKIGLNRILEGSKVYDITDVTAGRQTVLLLKEVNINV